MLVQHNAPAANSSNALRQRDRGRVREGLVFVILIFSGFGKKEREIWQLWRDAERREGVVRLAERGQGFRAALTRWWAAHGRPGARGRIEDPARGFG